MAVTNTDITYTNGNSGRTRINAAGAIVGVDFSDTSNTIATGPKTFTLTATANLNRDYSVGESVVAVAQAGATGSLIGTVTSYTPSTQDIIIEVASITGSGTGTNWRIGSTAFRKNTYDPVTMENKGQLVEGGATNLHTGSSDFTSPNFVLTEMSVTANTTVAPDGTSTADKLVPSTNNILHYVNKSASATVGLVYTHSVFAKAAEETVLAMRDNTTGGTSLFNLVDGTATAGNALTVARISAAGAGWFRCSISFVTGTGNIDTRITPRSYAAFAGDGTSGLFVWGSQVEQSSAPSSYIPTTTVSVTRAADQASITGTKFTDAFGSAGTIVLELTPIASAVSAVAGSLNDGTLNNAIRIAQKQSGTLSSIRKMATDGVTDVMAVNAAPNNILVSNGVDYVERADTTVVGRFGIATSGVANFLNVGSIERITSSSDSGQTFTNRGLDSTLGGAHYGIGRFVIAKAASDSSPALGSVIVSTDGLAFRRVNIPGLVQNLNEVTSNGTNQYVAVGNGGVIYTSPDAETWTAQTSGTTAILNAIHWFGGRYVIASEAVGGSRYSDNGTSWTTMTGLAVSVFDVHHNGSNLWVAVGLNGIIYSSTDGASWTQQTSPVSQTLRGIHFADGLWVAVGNAGTVVTSPDGTTWTDRTANSGLVQNINEVGFFNGKFYYGADNRVGSSSAANITANVPWTVVTPGVSGAQNGIATNGSRLLLCGTNGNIITSEDGTTFTSRTGNNATLNGAAFGNGTYVIVGNAINGSGLIATVNPTTFEYQRRVSGTTNTINDVSFVNGAFYAPHTAGIQRSTDGQTYTSHAIGGTSFTVNKVDYDGTRHIAVGSGGRYSLSTDNGSTWAASALNGVTTQNLNGLASFGGTSVAVGNAGVIITTTNGTTWTLRASGVTSNLFSVMYSTRDSMWYAAGDNGVILRAADPTGTWTSISNDATVGIFTAGALQANPLAGKFLVNQKNRVAIGWTSTGGVSISINGGDVVTDPSVTMPVLTQYSVGMNGLSGQHWNSTIKTQRAYRVRVSDDELKALSRV